MRSYWKIKLWAKFVNHFDVFDNLWSRKTQCDRSTNHLFASQKSTKRKWLNGHFNIREYLLRSHYRNYGEHKGLAVLNSELSKLSP